MISCHRVCDITHSRILGASSNLLRAGGSPGNFLPIFLPRACGSPVRWRGLPVGSGGRPGLSRPSSAPGSLAAALSPGSPALARCALGSGCPRRLFSGLGPRALGPCGRFAAASPGRRASFLRSPRCLFAARSFLRSPRPCSRPAALLGPLPCVPPGRCGFFGLRARRWGARVPGRPSPPVRSRPGPAACWVVVSVGCPLARRARPSACLGSFSAAAPLRVGVACAPVAPAAAAPPVLLACRASARGFARCAAASPPCASLGPLRGALFRSLRRGPPGLALRAALPPGLPPSPGGWRPRGGRLGRLRPRGFGLGARWVRRVPVRGLRLNPRSRKPQKSGKYREDGVPFTFFGAHRGAGVEKKLTGRSNNGIVIVVIAAPHQNTNMTDAPA